jgi:GNAT superfamily N-acetyltransferase
MIPGSNARIHRGLLEELSIARAVIDEYCDAVGVLIRDDQSQLEQYFQDDSGVWLAADGENIVGCVVLRPLPARTPSCEVKRLYVRTSHRGIGIADALMNALEDYAVAAGYRFAYLDTKDDLRAAIRFYERRGYRSCERYNANPQATIFMRRALQ